MTLTPDQIMGLNFIITPVLALITIYVKSMFESGKRQDIREDGLIKGLQDRVTALEKRLDDKEREMREIRVELKNRDEEYIVLYKDYTTLKAKYEVLQIDHQKLREQYEKTENELSVLKQDIKRRAEISLESAKTLALEVKVP